MATFILADGGTDSVGALRNILDSGDGIDLMISGDRLHAVDAVADRTFQGLIVDGRAEGIDPLALAVRALEIRADIPMVFVTAENGSNGQQNLMRNGGLRFASVEECLPAVETLLANNFTGDTAVDVLDLAKIAGLQNSSGAVRILSEQGVGTVRFDNGRIVHTGTDNLDGSDAFFEMVLWSGGRVESLSQEEAAGCAENIEKPVGDLLEEGLRFRRIIAGDDSETVDRSSSDEPHVRPIEAVDGVWSRLARIRPAGVRIVFACSDACNGSCYRRASFDLARELGGGKPWLSMSGQGPSFVRIHPKGGGILALTFVPVARKNEFLFETLSRSAEAVVMCCAEQSGEFENWKNKVPSKVVLEMSKGSRHTLVTIRTVLGRLADGGVAV